MDKGSRRTGATLRETFFRRVFFMQSDGGGRIGTVTPTGGLQMKTGVIVYVAGEVPEQWTEMDERHLRKAQHSADAVEIITSRTGHFDIPDAWRSLIARGMARVVCKMAQFDDNGTLVTTDREMVLCG